VRGRGLEGSIETDALNAFVPAA